MPLIQCPMCQKSISPNAVACPNCGEPIAKNNSTSNNDFYNFPNLPADLSIGKQIVNWGIDAAITGTYENCSSGSVSIPNGKANVLLHEKGIRLCGKFYLPIMDIHSSQIVSIKELSKHELKDKSIIGRAIIGGVLLGSLGAVIGGLSGTGHKRVKKYYLIINYWDVNTKRLYSLSIGCESTSRRFIERFNKQKESNYL